MKLNLLLLFVLSLASCSLGSNTLNFNSIDENFIYWEDLTNSEKNNILNTFQIDRNAINYYYGKFALSDNDIVTSLLETITANTEQEEVACFYFYIFNQICTKADGAISEIIGKYCQRIIINNPLYTIIYFGRNKKTLETYAKLIGYELYFKEEGTSEIEYNFDDFKKIIEEKAIPKEKYSEILTEFFERIEISMKNTD
jgi:hypothetical protein